MARVGIEPGDDPPVEDAEPSIPQQQQVAGVDVAVKQPVPEAGQEEGAEKRLREQPRVDAERRRSIHVIDRHTVEQLHGEHVAPCAAPIDGRDDDVVDAFVGQELSEVVHAAGFVAQVELLGHLLAEAGQESVQRSGDGDAMEGEEAEEGLHDVEVGGHHRGDAGAKDLDRHLVAVRQPRSMDDGDRRRRHRLGLDVGKGLA